MTQPFATTSNPVPTEIRSFQATLIDQEYRLFVSLPSSYTTSVKHYPVLYLLDGNTTFTIVRQIVELLQIPQILPELIIVGIGYPKDTYMQTLSLRGRDLSPTSKPPEEDSGGYPFEETGGGEKFLSFVEKELIPFIDREYRTDPEDRALVGWSLGGLFGIYTILKKPGLFKRVVAISPSLYWGNQIAFEMLKEFGQASLPVKLYLCIECPDTDPLLLQYLEEIKAFAEQLAKCSDADVKYQLFDGENHFTIGPIGMTRGLVEIYTP